MTDPRGFLKYHRRELDKEPASTRVRHFREFDRSLPVLQAREQAARCMGCGVPFCHTGCPLGNPIPDFNARVHDDHWDDARVELESTNNFPEITGRVCPAPCEAACVVGINGEPVAIKALERTIADRAGDAAFVPKKPSTPTGKRVAVVGSGPAGLACAQLLARAGHAVTVFEKDDAPGGLLRFGIPDFKLEKQLVDKRVAQLAAEGVTFECGVEIGVGVTFDELRKRFDAVVLATGAGVPRDLPIAGRALTGVHFAMEYLTESNRAVRANVPPSLHARDRHVVVIGGGDTGSDCVGTAHRQGASSVTQLEIMPRPPEARAASTPWPMWPLMMRTSSSQEEGGTREFAVISKRFVEERGRVVGIELANVAWEAGPRGTPGSFREVPGTTRVLEADFVLLALGFTGPDPRAFAGAEALALEANGAVRASTRDFQTSQSGVFACGDARRGQSLVVWAIWEGRETARAVDLYLMRQTRIESSPYLMAL